MPKRTIKMTLSAASIDNAIREIEEYKYWVRQKCEQLSERLAEIGAKEAKVRFGGAYYDSNNDVNVTTEPTENGWRIVAQGKAVFFIEFGAGVHFNGAESYPGQRPPGIVGIGEYGKGHGKRDTWVFIDENGNKVFTHGNPAAMPMYSARKAMEQEVLRIAKEVFG